MTLAGVRQTCTNDTMREISALWGLYGPMLAGHVLGTNRPLYGVVLPKAEKGFDYMAEFEAVEGSASSDLVTLDVPALRYSAFPHEGAKPSTTRFTAGF